jgi:hypothetical protein
MAGMKAGRRSTFTDAENARLRLVARELLARYGSQTALAEALGPDIQQPSLSAFLLEKYGCGFGLARKLAELKSMTLDQLLGRPGSGEHPAVDRYPNRAIVLDAAKRLGISTQARAKLAALRLVKREDAPIFWWLSRLIRFEEELLDTVHAVDLSPKPTG